MTDRRDAVWDFAEHAAGLAYEDLPPEAVRAAKTFLLDSIGVCAVGSAGPWVDELYASQAAFGVDPAAGSARVLASGRRLPAPAAALVNAYQIHNSEFDCVHEGAVVHPMAVAFGAVMAGVDAWGGVSGKDLLTALVAGIDVAAGLGVASKAPIRFFRPATAGGFGAAAALARLKGLDAEGVVNAMSAAYAQMGGTMQAHTEGSIVLAMQAGFNARNAVLAAEMAARGLDAPKEVLEGAYGYFALFEGEHDLSAVTSTLGRTWRVTEVAHKPFPSGRATHGLIDGVLTLMRDNGVSGADIDRIEARTPSLTHRLVGRPAKAGMTVNYARLSGQYAAATAALTGGVGIADFAPQALADPARLALAAGVDIAVDDNPDPNAFTPISVALVLKDGQRLETVVETVYGAPGRPMTETAHLAKFRGNCAAASPALPPEHAEQLIAMVECIEDVADARALLDLAAPAP